MSFSTTNNFGSELHWLFDVSLNLNNILIMVERKSEIKFGFHRM